MAQDYLDALLASDRIRASQLILDAVEGGQTVNRLVVTDHGQGIEPGRMKQLFKPFTTGTTGTMGEASTGLGLYICARLVEAHGGRIEVASEVGKGSTFSVILPHQT